MLYPHAENMKSKRSGKPVANQLIINTEEGVYFQSYDKTISFIPKNAQIVYADKNYWDYSRTTSKYLNQFLHKNTKEVKQLIKDGTIELVDLNGEE